MAMNPDPASSAPPRSDRDEKPVDRTGSPEEALKALGERLGEFVEYAIYYLASRLDAFKLAIKRRIVTASIIAVAVLAAAGAIVTATALLCEGICDALTELLGRRWAGELTTGVLLLGLVGITAYYGISRVVSDSHRRAIHRYEEWRRRQRERYGRDVAGRNVAGRTGDGERHE
jgi:hypothetical protein